MAKKREPSISDALAKFKEIMDRGGLKEFVRENQVLISVNPKGRSVIIIPEEKLWAVLAEDKDFMDHVRELDVTKKEDEVFRSKFLYAKESDQDGWLSVEIDKFYKGEVLHLTIDGFPYDIPFNKDHLPVKLKKAEYDPIQYKIILNPLSLGIKKKLDIKGVPDGGFVMLNFYQIV